MSENLLTLVRPIFDQMTEAELRGAISMAASRLPRLSERRPPRSPYVIGLIALAIGESTFFANAPGRLEYISGKDVKRSAREYLGRPDADWSCRTTNKRIRVTRTR